VAAAAPRESASPPVVLAGDGAVTPGATSTPAPNGSRIFLGTPRDQIELLADRAGEFHPFPRVVNLVLTNLCNLSCVMCPYHSPRYEKGDFFKRAKYMSDAIFEQVAREVAAHGSTLKLGQLEEVLIHPRLIPWIEHARDLGVPSVHITTNGTLLTPDKSEALMKAGLTTIYVSLDAATPETYQTVRGWKGGLEKVWENIDALIENRDRHSPETQIRTSFILQPEAVHERDAFVEMWRERGIDGVIVYQLSEHYNEGKTDFKTKYFDPTPPERRHACSSVWEEIYVYPQGEVSMCCNTMILVPRHGVISMGSITERSLEEIWLGAQYRGLRRRLLLNDIAGDLACQDCDIWDSSETRVEERDGMQILMNPTSAIYNFR
jgi:MoaA/NifB/PqqE/SkfB family radical SAM enzyme